MSSQTVAPARKVAAANPLPQQVRLPLLHCRHYVRNYFDLFQDLLARIYTAGSVTDDVVVEPGDTIGDALDLTEQKVASALVLPNTSGESVFLRLLRTILEDQDVAAADVDSAIAGIQLVLTNSQIPTFAQKADDLGVALTQLSTANLIAITEAQIDKMLGAFRSIGKLVADMIAFEFPRLVDYRQDLFWNPERYLLISGPYRAVLSSDPREVLSCSFANDKITIEIRFDSLAIDETADFEFFKVKEKNNGKSVTKEKHEMLMSAVGSLVFRDVRIALVLDDTLAAPTVYPWAPGHDVRRAEWTQPSVEISVDSVDLDLHVNAATILVSFLEGSWGSVQQLEEDLEDVIEESINSLKEIAGLADITGNYVSPIAQRLIPIAHALSSIQIAAPFEGLQGLLDADDLTLPARARGLAGAVVATQWEPVSHLEFDRLKTIYETRAVSIRNDQPDPPELEEHPIDDGDAHLPDNLDDVDPPGGTWAWPSQGGGFTQLDLNDLDDRAVAVGLLQRVPDLSARTRAIAALSVEGFSPRSIGAVRIQDFDAGAKTVFGRAVGATTITLLQAAQEEGKAQGTSDYLFRYGDFTATTYLVESDLRAAQKGVLRFFTLPGAGAPGGAPPQEQVIVPNFHPDIWDMKYAAKSPIRSSRGFAHDPGWVGLSTNCVVATTLYRKLKDQDWFKRNGEAGVAQDRFSYDLKNCSDAVADFSGDAPEDSPGLAIHELRIAIGNERTGFTEYKVDLRLRLKPYIYGHGCLPDDAVTYVSEALDCIEGMTGGQVPFTTRLRQLDFRDFVFLRADFTDQARDIQIVQLAEANGSTPANSKQASDLIRAAIAHWFPTVPEPPILYNSFRSVGGESRNHVAENGWLALYRRYPFPDFSNLQLG